MSSCECDIVGVTNDKEGKYFPKCCLIIDGECRVGDGKVPENYYDLSYDEQLSICESLEKNGVKIYYDVTRVVETDKIFG